MNFDFAITRVATFVRPQFDGGVPALKGAALEREFRRQARLIQDSPKLATANAKAFELALELDRTAARKSCQEKDRPDGIGVLAILHLADEFTDMSAPFPESEALVARMPSERIEVTVGNARWILRTRAHVTSCALEGNRRPTKLWWTFEGIPYDTDPHSRPNADAVGALMKLAADMEDRVREPLKDAFENSLKELTNPRARVDSSDHRLHITLSETADDNVDALLDALYFDDKTPSAIRSSKDFQAARKGMTLFEDFIHRIAGQGAEIDDDSIRLAEGIPKVKGILWHHTYRDCHMVAGFARRAGAKIGLQFMTEDERRDQLSEMELRMRSAARPLSAFLANSEAIAIEQTTADPR